MIRKARMSSPTFLSLNHKASTVALFVFAATLLINDPCLAQSGDAYYPERGESWRTCDPADVGMNAETLRKAVDFARANEYSGPRNLHNAITAAFEPDNTIVGPTKERGGPAGMIVKDGYLVAEWGDVERVDMTFSVTKSYLSTVAGLALDAGLIADVHDQVGDLVWDGKFDGPHNSKITWHHLLNQSSDWYGTLYDRPDWADRPPREGTALDWERRELKEPGTSFKYNDVRVNLLAYALLQVWRRPLPAILKEKIMDPIGASTTWRWYGYENSWVVVDALKIQSVSGGGHRGGGMFVSTRDQTRFGYLFLRNGKWGGEQLISEKWIQMLQESSEAMPKYGYMWWLNKGPDRVKEWPESVFQAAGFGGNYIFVDQTNDLLIVARWLEPSKMNEFVTTVFNSMESK